MKHIFISKQVYVMACWLLSAKSYLIPMRLFQNVLCQSVDTNTVNLNNIYKSIFVYSLTVTSRQRVKQSCTLPDCGSMLVKRGPFYVLYAHRMYMYIFASQITRKTRLFVQQFSTKKTASKFRITVPQRVNNSECASMSWRYYGDVIMSVTASKITVAQIVYSTGCSDIKENIKSSRQWLLWGESTGDRWNSPHKGAVTWKMLPFHGVIMSSNCQNGSHQYILWQ